MSGSSVHAALGALDVLFEGAKPSADWVVTVRRPYDPKRKFLAVGWDQGTLQGQPAVAATRALGNAAGTQSGELVEVSNWLSVWSGKDGMDEVEGEAFAAFDRFDAALTADLRLGGVVMLANITAFDYVPDFRVEGALAQIRFTVRLQAKK